MNIVLNKFLKDLKNRDISEKTIKGYTSDLKLFTNWFQQKNDEQMSIERITPTDIKEYKQYLLQVENHKANTINRHMASISSLLRWALTAKLIQINPMENIKPIKTSDSTVKWLDKFQQFSLQRTIEKDLQLSELRYPSRWVTRRRDASIVIFILHTGLRLNECMSLKLENVKLRDRKGEVLVQHGKGGKQRTIPLNAEARRALQKWLEVRPNRGKNLWLAVEDAQSEKLSDRSIQRVLKRYGQEAGIESLTPHSLRHTFAKNLVNQGVGLEKIALLLGHASLNTTQIYTKPDQKDLEQSVSRLENL